MKIKDNVVHPKEANQKTLDCDKSEGQLPQRRTKSPKKLKNLVIPSREYYRTPLESNFHRKETVDSFTNPSKNHSLARPKGVSMYQPKGEKNFRTDTTFCFKKKAHFGQTDNDRENKDGFPIESKKQNVSSVVDEHFSKELLNSSKMLLKKSTVYNSKKPLSAHSSSLHSKKSFVLKMPVVKEPKAAHLKPERVVDFSNPFLRDCYSALNKGYLLTSQVMVLIQNEQYLARFLKAFHAEESIEQLFTQYLDWLENVDFQQLIDKISETTPQTLLKSALLFERMSLYICNFIYSNDFQKEEIIFLKKVAGYIYLNFASLVFQLLEKIPGVS